MLKTKGRLLGAVLAVSLVIGGSIAVAPVSAAEAKPCKLNGNVKAFIKCLSKPKPVKKATAKSAAPQSNVTQSNYSYTVEEYIDYIVADVDKTWTKWFKSAGFEEPMTGIVKIEPNDPAYVSQCGLTVASDTANAFYCPLDSVTDTNGVTYQGALILPVLTFQKMWTGDVLEYSSADAGDFAAAYIIAHEFGHSAQDEISLQYTARTGKQLPDFTGPNKELIADCFAGVWMTSAYYSKLMEPGDIDEAIAAAEAIADPVGVVVKDPHGTSAQRKRAVLIGYLGIKKKYKAGDPLACVASYWK
ncbi:MAG TPA: neutral zinc metallopeptidase [Candidatus Microsaccharimonas sp.]|jgi:predicted metalloprotease